MSHGSIDNARIEWGEDGLPRSVDFGDVYFSRHDPMAETRHVFLEGNQLPSRFPLAHSPFVIAELGFGSGLNFLSTWQLWDELAPAGGRLHYIACEQFPLAFADLCRCHGLWPSLQPWAEALQAVYPASGAGPHRLILSGRQGPVILDLLYGEAGRMLADLAARAPATVDAWFLDGFAPRCNPDMWLTTLYSHMRQLSHFGTTLATYSVAAAVRQGLQDANFTVHRMPGYASKRHMLQGELSTSATPSPSTNRPANTVSSVTVIGAGLAGSACAHALAMRGIDVTVLERADEAAAGSSGNPQGALFLPLHRHNNPSAALLRQAAHFAARHYTWLEEEGFDIQWHPCGALQLHERNGAGFFDCVEHNPLYTSDTVRRVDAEEASAIAGVKLANEGLLLSRSGWLNPARLCRARLSISEIELRCASPVFKLEQRNGQWLALDAQGHILSRSEAVIVANAHEATRLLSEHQYPLFPNRGQLSFLRSSSSSQALASVLCGKGYLLPAQNGMHTLGSSFERRSTDSSLRQADHDHNMTLLETLAPALLGDLSSEEILGGRASLRCTTSDYLPLVGPVEDIQANYAEKQQPTREKPIATPGLFLCSGFGSHGITTSPLLAEHLVSLLTGEISPLISEHARLIAPGRFLMRSLKSGTQRL